jgi:hypothetical protein
MGDGFEVNVPVNTRLFGWIGLGMTSGSCSSGSTSNSTSLADFWSPLNEEPLDKNRLFWVKRLFLFAQPSPRVRCAAGAFATASPPEGRGSTPMGPAPSRHIDAMWRRWKAPGLIASYRPHLKKDAQIRSLVPIRSRAVICADHNQAGRISGDLVDVL